MIAIKRARRDDDIAAVTALAWECVTTLSERYPEKAHMIRQYLTEQRFEQMLADFRTFFNPQAGECFPARADGPPVGIVMLKPVNGTNCEMNRGH